jgi:hypothetical protein
MTRKPLTDHEIAHMLDDLGLDSDLQRAHLRRIASLGAPTATQDQLVFFVLDNCTASPASEPLSNA